MKQNHHWALWPGLLAVGPLTIAFTYLAKIQGWLITDKTVNEIFAVYILGLIFALLLARCIWQRSLLYLFMAGFALTAWLREIHFEWTHRGVYVLLLALIVLAWWWRERLVPLARTGSFLPWFKGTMVVYFLSVLISRRVFRGILPDEQPMHVALEEVMENVAHTMLLITSLVGSWKRPQGPVASMAGQRSSAER